MMHFKNKTIFIVTLIVSLAYLRGTDLKAQKAKDTSASLIRFQSGKRNSYKIPMTKFCFVKEAGLTKTYSNGWVMPWDIIKNSKANLLFMEMNSTDVENWLGNEEVRGSVQLVFELPNFGDSVALQELSYKSKKIYAINNYGGAYRSKESLNGYLKIFRKGESIIIKSSINLITKQPETLQQIILTNQPVPSLTFSQFEEFENARDSARKKEHDLMVNTLTQTILLRDSLWEIEGNRIKDSLKLHPYKGKFRFWASDIDKAGYLRTTYSITQDSIVIKKGPYDFIYLAKNYSADSVYFRKALNQNETKLLADIEQKIASDSLGNFYTNFCTLDGLILSFSFESATFSKDITVSNYYQHTIADVIEFLNKIVSKKYQIWYDKSMLEKLENECNEYMHFKNKN